jgi:hypothetical protein
MKPENVIRIGNISASIYLNEIETKEGNRTMRTANFQRRYRTEEGEWKTKNSFSLVDLPNAIEVLKRALDYVASKEVGDEE